MSRHGSRAYNFDVIISMGAPWSVYDHETIGSWVLPELAMLREAHVDHVPVFGICFRGSCLLQRTEDQCLGPRRQSSAGSRSSPMTNPWFPRASGFNGITTAGSYPRRRPNCS